MTRKVTWNKSFIEHTIDNDFEDFGVEGFLFLAGFPKVVRGLIDRLLDPVVELIVWTSLRLNN